MRLPLAGYQRLERARRSFPCLTIQDRARSSQPGIGANERIVEGFARISVTIPSTTGPSSPRPSGIPAPFFLHDMKEHPMHYRTLCPCGLLVSEPCLDTMTFDDSRGMWGQIGRRRQPQPALPAAASHARGWDARRRREGVKRGAVMNVPGGETKCHGGHPQRHGRVRAP